MLYGKSVSSRFKYQVLSFSLLRAGLNITSEPKLNFLVCYYLRFQASFIKFS